MQVIAAVTGSLADHFTKRGVPRAEIHAPIHQHPAFEHLEADGVKRPKERGGGHPA